MILQIVRSLYWNKFLRFIAYFGAKRRHLLILCEQWKLSEETFQKWNSFVRFLLRFFPILFPKQNPPSVLGVRAKNNSRRLGHFQAQTPGSFSHFGYFQCPKSEIMFPKTPNSIFTLVIAKRKSVRRYGNPFLYICLNCQMKRPDRNFPSFSSISSEQKAVIALVTISLYGFYFIWGRQYFFVQMTNSSQCNKATWLAKQILSTKLKKGSDEPCCFSEGIQTMTAAISVILVSEAISGNLVRTPLPGWGWGRPRKDPGRPRCLGKNQDSHRLCFVKFPTLK